MDEPTARGPHAEADGAGDDGAVTAAGPSLSSAEHDFESAGHRGEFAARDGAMILCLTCRQEFPADGQRADVVRRLEGASDPADMAVVIPLRCPACGTDGTLTTQYGPDASAEEAEVLLALDRTPSEG